MQNFQSEIVAVNRLAQAYRDALSEVQALLAEPAKYFDDRGFFADGNPVPVAWIDRYIPLHWRVLWPELSDREFFTMYAEKLRVAIGKAEGYAAQLQLDFEQFSNPVKAAKYGKK